MVPATVEVASPRVEFSSSATGLMSLVWPAWIPGRQLWARLFGTALIEPKRWRSVGESIQGPGSVRRLFEALAFSGVAFILAGSSARNEIR